jgi:hypothetical protein
VDPAHHFSESATLELAAGELVKLTEHESTQDGDEREEPEDRYKAVARHWLRFLRSLAVLGFIRGVCTKTHVPWIDCS